MPRVQRWFLGFWHGRLNCTYSWNAVNHASTVLVSAGEGTDRPGRATTQDPDRFVGDALITVHNIAPYGLAPGEGYELVGGGPVGGGVRFVLTVDWDEPLPIWADIVLLD